MKTQIYFYKLYLFNSKDEDDYIELTQEQGQQLAMILSSSSERKFVVIDDDVINTSAIRQLIREESKTEKWIKGKLIREFEIRELTTEEEKIQKLYDKFKGRKLLKSGE